MTAAGNWDYQQRAAQDASIASRAARSGSSATGRIGSEIARKAAPFGYRLLGYDPYVEEMKHGLQKVSLETLMSESDAIITAPTLNPTSRHVINAHVAGVGEARRDAA